MAIPIHLLSDREQAYESEIDFYSVRSLFSKPQRYTLFLTNRCNFKCNRCTLHIPAYRYQELTPAVWEKFISDTGWTHPSYTLSGGEPLLYPYIADVLSMLGRNKCDAEMVTNGYFLDKYIDQIIRNKVGLMVRMEGMEHIHNSISNCPGSYQKIIEVFDDLKVNNSDAFQSININCVLTPDNIADIDPFIDVLTGYPVNSISFQHIQYSNKSLEKFTNLIWENYLDEHYELDYVPNKAYIFDHEYILKLTGLVNRIKQKSSDRKPHIVFFPDFSGGEIKHYYSGEDDFLLEKNYACLKPWLNPTIYPNGDISSCNGLVIGNIQTDSFWQVWNGAKNQRFREVLLNHKKFPSCPRCTDFYVRYPVSKRGDTHG